MSAEGINKKRFQLKLSDTGGLTPRHRIIAPNSYFVGSDPSRAHDPRYVFLKGSALPLLACRLDLGENPAGWRLHSLVPDQVKLGDQILQQGESRTIADGARIRIRDASVTVSLPSTRSVLRQQTQSLSEIQISVYNDLLDFEEQQNKIKGMTEAERKDALSQHINHLLSQIVPYQDPATQEKLAHEALFHLLELYCLATEDDTRPLPLSPYAEISQGERLELQVVIEDMVEKMGLPVAPDDTAEALALLHRNFRETAERGEVFISGELQRRLIQDAVRSWTLSQRFDMGALEFLLAAPVISEVMICSYDRIFVEKLGKVFDTGLRFESETELERIAQHIASEDQKTLTLSDPLLDARMPDGSRVNAVLQPTSLMGNAITVRKFRKSPWTLRALTGESLMMSPAMEKFLRAAVVARKNIIISGGTGTGKTSLLNALALTIPYDQRIVTIEDTGELNIAAASEREDGQVPPRNLVALEARAGNFGTPITIRDLLRNALRMRPDRIIVGECRDGATLDMLQAMNTGHDGSMTSAHANSPEELLLRVENLALQGTAELPARVVRQQIASAIDLVVQVNRTESIDPDKRALGRRQRSVVQIAEVGDFEEETGTIPVYPIFEMADQTGTPSFLVSGYVPSFFGDLLDASGFEVGDFFDEALA